MIIGFALRESLDDLCRFLEIVHEVHYPTMTDRICVGKVLLRMRPGKRVLLLPNPRPSRPGAAYGANE